MHLWVESDTRGWRVRWRDYFGQKKSSPFFSTQIHAQRFAEMIAHQLAEQEGVSGPLSSTMTVRDAVEIFSKTQVWSSLTRRTNDYAMESAFLPRFGSLPLASIRPLDLGQYLCSRRESLSEWTYYWEQGLIKRLFRWAKANMLIAVDPAQNFRPRQPHSSKHRCLSWQEESQLFHVARQPLRHSSTLAQLTLCRDTGMRVSNVHRLRRGNLDFEHRTVSFVCLKSHVHLILPWTERLGRSLQLFPRLPPHAWLFPHASVQRGGIFYSEGELLASLSQKAGFVCSAHDLRHTFKTRFYEATKDQLLSEYVMGHSMRAHIDSTYWHPPSPEALREAFDVFDKYQQEKLRPFQTFEDVSPAQMWRELENQK
jgi:integrase